MEAFPFWKLLGIKLPEPDRAIRFIGVCAVRLVFKLKAAQSFVDAVKKDFSCHSNSMNKTAGKTPNQNILTNMSKRSK